MASLQLAWQYLRKRPLQAGVLIATVTLSLYLPIATHWLITVFDKAVGARAAATPMLVGSKGSRLDLALHGLYFRSRDGDDVPNREYAALKETGLATIIPLHVRYTAGGQPVVGTMPNYFRLRKLRIASGVGLSLPGDCVLGVEAAAKLDLSPGDKLKTDRDNLFDLAGDYPLQLNVKGVFAPKGTADDEGVFVSLKTSWIIAGIWHGHDEDDETPAGSKLLKKHLEITPENVESFHSHGDSAEFPLTAISLFPHDEKATALLLGRYGDHETLQALKPPIVVAEMMGMVVRIRRFLDANHVLIAVITLLLLTMIVFLSRRLRFHEMETMFLLGCSRRFVLALQAAELAIVFVMSILLAFLSAWVSVEWMRSYLNTLTG